MNEDNTVVTKANPFVPLKRLVEVRDDVGNRFNIMRAGGTAFASTADAMAYCISALNKLIGESVMVMDVEAGEWKEIE